MSGKDETVFFLDQNTLGRKFVQILREAGAKVEVLSDHFSKTTSDVEWLAEVGRRGWLVVTRDQAIGNDILEEIAVAQANVRMFAFVMGNASKAELERDMGEAIAKMERFARSHKAPFIAKVYAYGKVRKWRDREKLLSTLRQYGLTDDG
ncbi:MAG: hypothetical protein F6K30_13465 [Cyanothece sp. SIO2G6]|nr:hypothetical protein [Cyanothece sp. SIO2G6]